MAIAFGASDKSSVVSAANTASTPSITVSGSNTVGIMGAFARDSASTSDIDISSATWNSVAMTSIPLHSEYPSAAFLGVDLWYIIGPTTGVVTANWAGNVDTGGMFAIYFTGVAQSSPIDITGAAHDDAANNTDPTVTFSTTVANGMLVDCFYNKTGSDLTVGASQTSIAQLGVNAGGDRAGGSYKATTTTGSYTMTWAASPDDDWVSIALHLKPFVASTFKARTFMTLGVGA